MMGTAMHIERLPERGASTRGVKRERTSRPRPMVLPALVFMVLGCPLTEGFVQGGFKGRDVWCSTLARRPTKAGSTSGGGGAGGKNSGGSGNGKAASPRTRPELLRIVIDGNDFDSGAMAEPFMTPASSTPTPPPPQPSTVVQPPASKGPYGRPSERRRSKGTLENTHYISHHGLESIPLLTKDEEFELGVAAQRWLPIERIRKDFEDEFARQPTAEEWAQRAHLSVEELEAEMVEGKRAVQHLVRSNIRLVLSIARKYRSEFVDYSDLIQEGTLGLLRAVKKFDPHRGFKFGTYATWWIQQGMLRCLSNDSRVVRIPVHVQALYSKYKKLRQKLEYERGEEVTDEELAPMLGISVKRLRQHMTLCKPQRFFEDSVGSVSVTGEAMYFYELYGDSAAQKEAEANAHMSSLQRSLQVALKNLNAEERQFLRMRYGLDDGKPKTTREIAEYAKVTIEYVRKTQVRALQRLRSADTYRLLQYYVNGNESMQDLFFEGRRPSEKPALKPTAKRAKKATGGRDKGSVR